MSAKLFSAGARSLSFAAPTSRAASMRASFGTSSRRLNDAAAAAPLPVRKPVGAFRGGLFGFLLGTTVAGAGVYGYVLNEYREQNQLLTEDIYALQAACQRLGNYVKALEEKMDEAERKKK